MNKSSIRSWLAGLLATDADAVTSDARTRLAVEPLDRRDMPSVSCGFALSGSVYVDTNCNGARDCNEAGIAGVKVTLTGKDNCGKAVCRDATTDCNGNYKFENLGGGCYTLTESQPAGYRDGRESGPTCATGNDTFGGINLNGCSRTVSGYNFGEEKIAKPDCNKDKDNSGKCDLWFGFDGKGDCDDKYTSCGYGYQPCDDQDDKDCKDKSKDKDICGLDLVGGALKALVSSKLSLLFGIGKC